MNKYYKISLSCFGLTFGFGIFYNIMKFHIETGYGLNNYSQALLLTIPLVSSIIMITLSYTILYIQINDTQYSKNVEGEKQE